MEGTLTVISPIPEPETYDVHGGLGLIGLLGPIW